MKNCEYWQMQISRFLDGDLSPEEENALWEHIAGCPDCAQAFEELSQQTSVLRAQVARPPVDLSRLVMARIKNGQFDPVRFQPEKPVTHRLRPWRKVAAAACFVALVAAGAVAGVFSRGAHIAESAELVSASAGADAAAYLPQAQSDTVIAMVPSQDQGGSGTVSGPEEPVSREAQEQPAENAAPAPDGGAVPGPVPEAELSVPETEQDAAPPAGDIAPDEAAPAQEPSAMSTAEGGGIMTIMEPAATEADDAEPIYIFTGDGVVAGTIADTGALTALLTGESWQGGDPAVLYTVALDGAGCAFAQDESGALLWRRADDAGWTLSPASLADLEALIVR